MMNYKYSKISFAVVIAGNFAGTLQFDKGKMAFEYDPDYSGPNLSASMQRANSMTFDDSQTRPVVSGLLPDNDRVRETMADRIGASSSDLASLLHEYGKDLPGAIQVCTFDELDSVLASEGKYAPVSDNEIANRLTKALSDKHPAWHYDSEHWSLGGYQGKFALAYIDGQWMSCEGAYPSTHIIKPGVSGMPYQALVEFISMQTASRLGLPTAKTLFDDFCGVPAIIIERYDRVYDGKNILRLHQEDLCQALGFDPNRKYRVSAKQAVEALEQYTDKKSVQRFADALLFNYLIGGLDAHAKNFSLIHLSEKEATLAPLYDVASVLPYEKPNDGKVWRKLPMDIGGEKRIGALTGSNIQHFAEQLNIDTDECKAKVIQFAEQIPGTIDEICNDFSYVDNIEEVHDLMHKTISINCEYAVKNIDRTHAKDDFICPDTKMLYCGTLPQKVN